MKAAYIPKISQKQHLSNREGSLYEIIESSTPKRNAVQGNAQADESCRSTYPPCQSRTVYDPGCGRASETGQQTGKPRKQNGQGSSKSQMEKKAMNKMGAEYLMKDLATWSDYRNSIEEELGITLKIRVNE